MGNFQFDYPKELTEMLEKMLDDSMCPGILERTTPIIKNAVVRKAGQHKVSGDMLKSIKEAKPKQNKYGWYSVVRPTGKDKKGVRNMEKMAYLEYGANNHGQPATPVLAPAISGCETEVLDKLQKEFERAVGV